MGDDQHLPDTVQRIGGFRLLRRLGSGGGGTVYEAYQESLRRPVALKVLHPHANPASDGSLRFEREAWIGGRLHHPNIVHVYVRGAEGESQFIAMALAPGGPLATLICDVREKPTDSGLRLLEPLSVARLFVGVADGLEHVHQLGIVHRDIKPSNLLFDAGYSYLMLTDFGAARDEALSRMTESGSAVGTVRYMSPEQLRAERAGVDRRSDLWSLGVSLYEALTLELPFDEETDAAYFYAIMNKDPIPFRTRRRVLAPDLEKVVLKCLERAPEHRYATAGELKEDLLRFIEGRPVRARRPSPTYRLSRYLARNRRMVATVTAAVALLAALAFAALWTLTVHAVISQSADRAIANAQQAALLVERAAIDTSGDPAGVIRTNRALGALCESILATDPTCYDVAIVDSAGRVLLSFIEESIGGRVDRHPALQNLTNGGVFAQSLTLFGPPRVFEAVVPLEINGRAIGEARVGLSTRLLRDLALQRTWLRILPANLRRWPR